jgi:HJR/Mrr/RecB family endonuclease
VLQCKLYSNPVGNKAVQEAHAARGFYEAKWAIVVSNRTYTPSARELAHSLGVVLVHHDELATLHERLEE